MNFLDADYSAIEARITPWLAGQEDALEEYRRGVDRYKVMAALIYKVPEDKVNKHPQRFVGKQATLGCIAEGELVLTDSGLVPIEKVKRWHRVWDGVEWVTHEGVIYQGEKEVITYDGLTATPDHIVFVGVGSERTTDLWSAREQTRRLTVSAEEGTPVRTLDFADEQSFPFPAGLPIREGEVQMWDGFVSRPLRVGERIELGLRPLRARRSEVLSGSTVVGEANGSSQGPLHQSRQSELQTLWRTGDQVSVQVSNPRRQLDLGQFGSEAAFDIGSEKQQWALRAWEPALRNTTGAGVKLSNREIGRGLQSLRLALLRANHDELFTEGDVARASSEASGTGSSREAQRVAQNQTTARTYDILNAGPRHRFTVSGKLVHNCGFGMGPSKFRDTCWKMGRYKLPAGLEDIAVSAWRAKHKKVVSYWYDMERAAKNAILYKGKVFEVRKHIKFMVRDVEGMPFLLLRLPSGRKLAYPKPRISNDRITFFGNVKGTTWGDISTWGGSLVENAVQAVAADIMAHGAHNCERAGYQICTLIHDQALSYFQEGQTPERYVALLTDLPAWAEGLPIAAEGGLVPFYKKD